MDILKWMIPALFVSYQLSACKTSTKNGQASLESQTGDGNVYVYSIRVSGEMSELTQEAKQAYNSGDFIPFGLRKEANSACVHLGSFSGGNIGGSFTVTTPVVLKEKLSQQLQKKLNVTLCNGRCSVTFDETRVSLKDAFLSTNGPYNKKPLTGLTTLDLRMGNCDGKNNKGISHMGKDLQLRLGTNTPRELGLYFTKDGDPQTVQLLYDTIGYE